MERIITYSFGENFIDNLAVFLQEHFIEQGKDLNRIACVFGGKRPALFLRRALSKRIKKSFIPPRIFSIDDFVDYLNFKGKEPLNLSDLDNCFLIYTLAQKHLPGLLKGRDQFSEFLPWAKEIVSFIEQLDLEDISNDSLRHIERSAQIGYDVPSNINHLLQDIIVLRDSYHSALGKMKVLSRGMRYLQASRCIGKDTLDDFDSILFCNFFYLHKTEQRIVKNIYDKSKGICIFQGDSSEWSVLASNAKNLGVPIKTDKKEQNFNVSLYRGFDIHSQMCITHHLLKNKIKDKNNTVIIVPRPEVIVPLLTEISSSLDEFNVSMGYPLKRSSVYDLFKTLAKAQAGKRKDKYYSKDYLGILRHPLIKNLKINKDPAITRVIVHKIEECLQGAEDTSIGGSLFIDLKEIEEEEKIYTLSSQTLKSIGIKISIKECKSVLTDLHDLLLRGWEDVITFNDFSSSFDRLLKTLIAKSMLAHFPFNLKVIDKFYSVNEEFKGLSFGNEPFSQDQLWDIFDQKLQGELLSFSGSPLRGLQILGLFESRSLNFKNVIITDMNESILPKLKIYEPLIPREVMLRLGLNRLEKEEEIQRYQFMRLIASAKNVHLIYAENKINEKSRLIEEILWNAQKKSKKLDVANISEAVFGIEVCRKTARIKKNKKIVDFLKKQTYSASRINTYLRCPLQFYYQYVLGLKEKEDLLTTPEASCIGTFMHQLLEDAFKIFKGKKPIIDDKFKKYFRKLTEENFDKQLARRMRSDSFLLKKIIIDRLEKFLDREIDRNVAKIICLEENRVATMPINGVPFNFNYTVDRIDELQDGSLTIIDYKTGGADIAPRKFCALSAMPFNRQAIKDNIKSFQLPLYHYFVSQDFPNTEVNAQLYNIRNLQRVAFISEDDTPHKEQIMTICLKALETIFAELFDTGIAFEADRDERKCQFCPFGSLCY